MYNKLLSLLIALSVGHLFFSYAYFLPAGIDDVYFAAYMYEHFNNWTLMHSPTIHEFMPLRGSFLQTAIYAPLMHLFDDSFFIHRVPSLILACIFLVLLYKIIAPISGQTTALQVVLLFSLLGNFVRDAHLARPEMLLMCLMFASFYLQNRAYCTKKLFFASFLVGLTITVHPIGLLSVVLFIYYEIISGRLISNFSKKYFLYGFLGFTLALTVFILDNFIALETFLNSHLKYVGQQYQQSYAEQVSGLFFIPRKPQHIFNFIQFFLPILCLIGLILLALIKKDKKSYLETRWLIGTFLMLFFAFIALGRSNLLYLLLFSPFLFWALSIFMQKSILGKVIFWCFVVGNATVWAAIYQRQGGADPSNYIKEIKQITQPYLKPSTHVIGSDHHWFIFRNQPFDSIPTKRNLAEIAENCDLLILLPTELWQEKSNQKLSDDQSIYRDARRIRLKSIEQMELIGQVKDKHYGTLSNTLNNTLNIYYRPPCFEQK